MMTVLEIVGKWLKDNGYHGLCSEECGCGIDDLAPCGDYCTGCVAAYKWHCKDCQREDCGYRDEVDGCYRADRQNQ